MLRKLIIVFAATAAIGAAAIPTSASAHWHGGWYGGWHGGWHGGWRGSGWGYYPYAFAPIPYYGGCYRTVRVSTPYGWRWRHVWVCG
jgi:hypothetical protein